MPVWLCIYRDLREVPPIDRRIQCQWKIPRTLVILSDLLCFDDRPPPSGMIFLWMKAKLLESPQKGFESRNDDQGCLKAPPLSLAHSSRKMRTVVCCLALCLVQSASAFYQTPSTIHPTVAPKVWGPPDAPPPPPSCGKCQDTPASAPHHISQAHPRGPHTLDQPRRNPARFPYAQRCTWCLCGRAACSQSSRRCRGG